MPNLSLNSSTSPSATYSGAAAYDAYEALMNPAGTSRPNTGMGGMSGGVGINGVSNNGISKAGSSSSPYGQMDGADLLNGPATDDILALLSNTNFEPPFDFGMMYSTDGNPGPPNGGGGPGAESGPGGMFSPPGSMAFVNGSGGGGPGSGSGTVGGPLYEKGPTFSMGTV